MYPYSTKSSIICLETKTATGELNMDKQNYTLKNIKSQDVNEIIVKIKKKFGEKLQSKQAIKRKRVIKSYDILVEAVFLYITQSLSFQRLSDLMALKFDVAMSDTAWRKQILKIADDFMEAAEECIQEVYSQYAKERSLNILKHKRCYVLDATDFSMEGQNRTVIRLHTQYVLDAVCSNFTSITDEHTAESTTHFPIEEEALYLADRAYGTSRQLNYLNENKADYIIRISPSHIKLFKTEDCREKIDIHKHLSNESFSIDCFVKYEKKVFPIKVIGIMKPEDKHEEAEKKVKRKAQEKQNNLSQKTLDYSKWLFVAVPKASSYSYNDIVLTYKLRWQIELFFKRMKSLMHFRKIKRSSAIYAEQIVKLWFAVGFLISSVNLLLYHLFDFDVSPYNLFSLILLLFS